MLRAADGNSPSLPKIHAKSCFFFERVYPERKPQPKGCGMFSSIPIRDLLQRQNRDPLRLTRRDPHRTVCPDPGSSAGPGEFRLGGIWRIRDDASPSACVVPRKKSKWRAGTAMIC